MRASVGLSSALWQNGGSDPDAVWRHRLDRSRDQAGSGVRGSVHGKGTFGDEDDARTLNTRIVQRKRPIPHSTMKTHRNM